MFANNITTGSVVMFNSRVGRVEATVQQHAPSYKLGWEYFSGPASWYPDEPSMVGNFGRAIGTKAKMVYFPLWYPALIFALAGVGVLRFRRQFSIRSALIATTVVAALIAVAVIL